ncbi:MAG: hypothetical protein QOG99_407, partial [Frankiales bacterium]|nr:hypothetical protein [Frankiales bacterium]
MKHELSEMLAASKENPPPPRYTVEDALTAGRKRQSRRRVLFAGAGSAAAVVAVAAAIAVPQIVTRTSPNPSTVKNAAPAASGTKKPALFAYPVKDFTGNIAPFKSGDLAVSGTVQVTTSYELATIVAPGKGTSFQDAQGKIHTTANDIGTVVIYRAGVFSPSVAIKSGSKVTVGGKPGYYTAGKAAPTGNKKLGVSSSPATLTWEYADDSWAVVTTSGWAKLTRDDMINLAQNVTSATAEEMAVDFKLGYVPKGFVLEAAGPSDSGMQTPMDGESFLRVVKGGTDYTGLTQPILDAPVVGGKQLATLSLAVYPSWYSKHAGNVTGTCLGGQQLCYKTTKDGKFVVELSGGGFLPDSELLKVVKGVSFADPTD